MASSTRDASEKMHVAVIGGGVIGLCTAYYALRAGKRVTVLERDGEGAYSCSTGNAGMVVPSHFIPLAAPGMISLGLRWMLKPESPFAIRMRPSRDLMRWAYLFWRHANKKHVAASRELLRDLSLKSRALFCKFSEEEDYGLKQRGLIMLCAEQKALDEEAHVAEQAEELGLDVEVCDAKRLAEVDPGIEMAAAGGIWFKQDCHMAPHRFVEALRRKIVELGGEIRYGVEVQGFVRKDGRVGGAICNRLAEPESDGGGCKSPLRVEADQFVIAGGAWSPDLARELGVKLPMAAGKGYSMTVREPVQLPELCSILTEARVAVTPMGDSLRFAGTMEIGKNDLSVNERRIAGIVKSIPRYFPQFKAEHFEGIKRWAGLRPCSPDGLPYMGPAGGVGDNVFIASGHSMMGLSLAPVTGQLMAQLLCGERPEIDIAKLAVERF